MLWSLAKLYVQGVKVDWVGFDRDYQRQKVTLPTYLFQRQRYWRETKVLRKNLLEARLQQKEIHPLLGNRIKLAGQQKNLVFESLVGAENPTYLSHYQVFEKVLFPTTGYLEIAYSAAKKIFTNSLVTVADVVITRGLILAETEIKTIQTILTPAENNSYKFEIFSTQGAENQEDPEWVLHTKGKIYGEPTAKTKTIDLAKYQKECSQAQEIRQHYQQCQQLWIKYGSSFQRIKKLWKGESQAIAQISLPQEITAEFADYNIHPVLLDAALQVIFHVLPEETKWESRYLSANGGRKIPNI